MAACNNSNNNKANENATVAENPIEIFAIDSVPFFISEMEYSAMEDSILAKYENLKWRNEMLGESPYSINGFGFNNIKGLFSQPEGQLIGLVFRYTDMSEYDTKFNDNWGVLKTFLTNEYGSPADTHTGLTENDIRKKEEVPTEMWSLGKKSILTTISHDGAHFGVNLYIYRNDKVNPDTTSIRRIDGDLAELHKLM